MPERCARDGGSTAAAEHRSEENEVAVVTGREAGVELPDQRAIKHYKPLNQPGAPGDRRDNFHPL